MFTGIIHHQGQLKNRQDSRLDFSAPDKIINHLKIGDSIAINGTCLTVTTKTENEFSVEITPETEQKTTLKNLKIDQDINLELPTTPFTTLDGHLVQGHVDGVGTVKKISTEGNSLRINIEAKSDLLKYLAPKGSVAVDGISLSVVNMAEDSFSIVLIPHTIKTTTLGQIKLDDQVNIEVDIIGKYIWKYTNATK
ncbi:riboflavin synthase [bacterium]|nr:riboflavin synthase [bacterium]|tara:strand:+ start:23 stop:607 length:585 start_codon:yes stop_codon:yes gene_type:complete